MGFWDDEGTRGGRGMRGCGGEGGQGAGMGEGGRAVGVEEVEPAVVVRCSAGIPGISRKLCLHFRSKPENPEVRSIVGGPI